MRQRLIDLARGYAERHPGLSFGIRVAETLADDDQRERLKAELQKAGRDLTEQALNRLLHERTRNGR